MAIFNKTSQSKEKQAAPETNVAEAVTVKYPKPKILLLDLPETASKTLAERGFNISTGTLGKPYKVAKGSGYQPLIGKGRVPNYTEQEIVIVDLAAEELDNGPQGEKHRPDGESDLWGKCDKGFLDPRVRTSLQVRNAFDRTLATGGVFAVFADARTGIEIQVASVNRYNELCHEEKFMRELNRTDIVGLSIINHQRHMPPLERDNAMPFRQELLDAAEERMLGLMTAWNLYRLVRNCKKFGGRSEEVKPVFYEKGWIDAVPKHYQCIGTIAKAWTDKFGVVLKQGELRIGDRIALEFPIEFEEVTVDSIRVKDQNVTSAKAGDPAGFLWPAGKPKLREGLRVFRILGAEK